MPDFERFKRYIRLESAILLVVLVLAAGGVYLYQEEAKLNEEVEALEDDKRLAREDLQAMKAETAKMGEELAQKEAELEQALETIRKEEVVEVEAPQLSTRREAIGLSSELITFAAGTELALTDFDTSETSVEVGALELPGFNYAVVAAGSSRSLLEMLRIVADVTSARINSLDFERDVEGTGEWVMSLDVDVAYTEEG